MFTYISWSCRVSTTFQTARNSQMQFRIGHLLEDVSNHFPFFLFSFFNLFAAVIQRDFNYFQLFRFLRARIAHAPPCTPNLPNGMRKRKNKEVQKCCEAKSKLYRRSRNWKNHWNCGCLYVQTYYHKRSLAIWSFILMRLNRSLD